MEFNDPSPPAEEINPYASPREMDEPPSFSDGPLASLRYRGTLQSFRTIMHILGGLWIAFASLVALAALFLLPMQPDPLFFVIMLIPIVLWGGLGTAVCFKQMWAVWTGLVLAYLTVVANLLQGNLCALILVVPAIILAHIAISKAGQLKRAGIPLNTLPRALKIADSNPFTNPNFDGIDFEPADPNEIKFDD